MLHNLSKQIKIYIKCQNPECTKIFTIHKLVHGFTLTILAYSYFSTSWPQLHRISYLGLERAYVLFFC